MKPAPIPILVLGMLLVFTDSVFGQQFETIYPNGLTAIAERPLSSAVYLSQQNIIKIRGEFFQKNQPDAPPIIVQASGFVEKDSNYVVSARHLLVETVMELAGRFGEPFSLDKNGIPRGVGYDYRFFAVLDTATERKEYPLTVVAMGPLDTYLDVMLFKPTKNLPVKSLGLSNKVRSGDKVYVSGFTSQNTH
ncbi:MAG: hypothetical protein A2651_03970 [Candidatus Yanofskybacteria bacterium RIFCSPHIGHO2_01_FULL_42_12]|uniref:Uncharacterized protein n=1 Tax=Candidatus Yanofskybacteria bacterium RIFCSPLOWO2_01_FULL_42_49 TaxID=1802694 RepID=A0A1F8GC67_9BACT|nr:MAG: hypothetical protein A2651_03970 [Candidatus Yanofskybacteria bacterium RIFCSPHIGHO2_01_FULL_42_12]OGN22328.1 MAG: hypothetical protein A2918_00195 [Candidatus Yanofskybacteria bacterium RIFCSPLOWO2_01_FULL_42_49]